jgi:hypothetical protein
VAAAVAVTVPAAAAAPAPPPVIAGIQVVGKRSETPRGWPDGTPTARTTMPPRAWPRPVRRRRGGRLLVSAVIALAVLGGSVFAGFCLGVFGGGSAERPATVPSPAAGPAVAKPAAPAVARPVEHPDAPPPPAAEPDPAIADDAPPPPAAEPDPEPAIADDARPPARTKKRARKSAPARRAPAAPEGAADNVIDPFR